MDAWEGLGHVGVDTLGLAEPGERGRDDLLERDRAHDQLHRTGLEAAHVEQVADQVVEPVGAVVDRLEQLASRRRCEVHVALQQAAHRRLDRRERRAQIVRHRREECGPQLVRLFEISRAGGVGPQRVVARQSPPARQTPGARRSRRDQGRRRGPRGRRGRRAAPRDRRCRALRAPSAPRRRRRPSRNQTSGTTPRPTPPRTRLALARRAAAADPPWPRECR